MVTFKDVQLLNEFLTDRGISFVLTGSVALMHHGFLSADTDVHDIDIIVMSDEEEKPAIESALSELEKFTGGAKYNYTTGDKKCYSFKIGANNVIVNAFVSTMPVPHKVMICEDTMYCVHDMLPLLKSKFKLGRPKDYKFFHKLINDLSAMFEK